MVLPLVRSFVPSFLRSFVRLFVRSFMFAFIASFVHAFLPSLQPFRNTILGGEGKQDKSPCGVPPQQKKKALNIFRNTPEPNRTKVDVKNIFLLPKQSAALEGFLRTLYRITFM